MAKRVLLHAQGAHPAHPPMHPSLRCLPQQRPHVSGSERATAWAAALEVPLPWTSLCCAPCRGPIKASSRRLMSTTQEQNFYVAPCLGHAVLIGTHMKPFIAYRAITLHQSWQRRDAPPGQAGLSCRVPCEARDADPARICSISRRLCIAPQPQAVPYLQPLHLCILQPASPSHASCSRHALSTSTPPPTAKPKLSA